MKLYIRNLIFSIFFVFPNIVSATILYQNPNFNDFNSDINKFRKSDLLDIDHLNNFNNIYIAGFSYLNGNEDKSIKRNCDKAISLINHAVEIGIVDAKFLLASDALHAQSQGRSLGAENLIIMGSVAIAGGVATIATAILISSGVGFILGVLLGLVTLVLGYFFITLVKPSVETWIDRSFIGQHKGQIEKFKNVKEEQNSLEMVMAGVIVDFSTSWVDKEDFGYYNYQGTAPQFFFYSDEDEKEYFKYANGRNVAIKIKVPKNKNINLSLKLQSINSESIFLYSNYSNYNSQDVLKEIDTHRAQLAAKSSGDNSLFGEDFKLIKDCYILNFKKNFSKKELSNGIRLSLSMEINKLFPSRLNDYFELDF